MGRQHAAHSDTDRTSDSQATGVTQAVRLRAGPPQSGFLAIRSRPVQAGRFPPGDVQGLRAVLRLRVRSKEAGAMNPWLQEGRRQGTARGRREALDGDTAGWDFWGRSIYCLPLVPKQ